MKAVLISIHPQNVENICTVVGEKDGKPVYKKSIEVRKMCPKLEVPFKCFIYETKGKYKRGSGVFAYDAELTGTAYGRGKVIGEFVCDRIDEIKPFGLEDPEDFERQSCLRMSQIVRYLGGLYGYGWHISDLKIYDKPKELGEFRKPCLPEFVDKYDCSSGNKTCSYFTEEEGYFGCCKEGLTRPPQSWCYVET